uniref:Uncharacterized protein n=1 Tax=Triticum urartu TaxID=4572 RepID=A0A8R7TJX5_TRIUA
RRFARRTRDVPKSGREERGSHEARSRRDPVLLCLLATVHTGLTPSLAGPDVLLSWPRPETPAAAHLGVERRRGEVCGRQVQR